MFTHKKYPPFSVAMSVYKNDNPQWFDRALKSITVEQTVKPDEIVLIIDGTIPGNINQVIVKYQNICEQEEYKIKIIRKPINQGLGESLKTAVLHCRNELIARMDSDDVSRPYRFEKQLGFMQKHPEVSIVGGQIREFIGDMDKVVGKRCVPCCNAEIKHYMKRRCPFNHMTVMFRKQAVIAAGNYKSWPWNEDYYLWIRLAEKNFIFANLSHVLVDVQVGKDMYQRRGGIEYFKSEAAIQKLMLQKKIINVLRYTINILVRLILQMIMPNNLRGFIFRKFARK